MNCAYPITMTFRGCLQLETKRTNAKVRIPSQKKLINKIKICNKWHIYFSECNCNDHSDTCTFNPSVYAASGNVSGGVCDNCTHNTEGFQCQFCVPMFYQDPTLELNDPEICKGKYFSN